MKKPIVVRNIKCQHKQTKQWFDVEVNIYAPRYGEESPFAICDVEYVGLPNDKTHHSLGNTFFDALQSAMLSMETRAKISNVYDFYTEDNEPLLEVSMYRIHAEFIDSDDPNKFMSGTLEQSGVDMNMVGKVMRDNGKKQDDI